MNQISNLPPFDGDVISIFFNGPTIVLMADSMTCEDVSLFEAGMLPSIFHLAFLGTGKQGSVGQGTLSRMSFSEAHTPKEFHMRKAERQVINCIMAGRRQIPFAGR